MTELIVRIQNKIEESGEQRGAALVEYGFLLALVAILVMLVLAVFGDTLEETFGFAADTLANSPALSENAPAE